jgi:predicted HAD superfamily Cof-like phosphohydrolase
VVSKIVESVCTFNKELLGINRANVALLPSEEVNWLRRALQEEVDEFTECHSAEQLVPSVDALIDLIYFAIGGLWRMGLTTEEIDQCFEAVHQANMTKRKGQKASRPTDGSVADAIKPPEWIDPAQLLARVLNV